MSEKPNHQRHRLSWRWIETKRLVKGSGLVRDRMYDNSSDADAVRRMRDPQSAVAKERAAEAPTLLRSINRQSSEHHDGNWIRHVATEAAAAAGGGNGARCQRVVTDYLVIIGSDEGA